MVDPKCNSLPDIKLENAATRTLALRGIKTIADMETYLHAHGAICVAPSPAPLAAMWAEVLSKNGVPAEVRDWRGHSYIMTSVKRQFGVLGVYGEALVAAAIQHLYNLYEQELAAASLAPNLVQAFCIKHKINLETYERDCAVVWHKIESNLRRSNHGRGYMPFMSGKLSAGIIGVLHNNGYDTPMDVYCMIRLTGGISFPELTSHHKKIARYLQDIGLNVQCVSSNKRYVLVEGTKT